ncbi:hypothetical protein SLNWT_2949 [Streptomyces albus]|uniref:Uncharacterized protein n=1 Tax=Streptomyces albus (strain ATCC 21838 / DSM 41398 / FERM P-419 / JCM 4703 / NBRC 107858) TaxID=1081613 RepID=A0A0B5EVU9_STRA4|nr:hypothetical protein SLNWT_2949 [Streptomyces albus]AOU77639.1 hypothetical protein SLNHY_2948 [Streptomyces albus]AYN33405.1 hypothetical protein DUI70_2904 [Streptomyces albus]
MGDIWPQAVRSYVRPSDPELRSESKEGGIAGLRRDLEDLADLAQGSLKPH